MSLPAVAKEQHGATSDEAHKQARPGGRRPDKTVIAPLRDMPGAQQQLAALLGSSRCGRIIRVHVVRAGAARLSMHSTLWLPLPQLAPARGDGRGG